MSPEHVLILTIGALVALLNLLAHVLRRRSAGRPAPAPASPGPETPERAGARPPSVRRPRRQLGGPASDLLPPSLEVARRRPRPAVRIAGRREARRAMVLMAVFGPCRGLVPPRPRQGGGPAIPS